jgi:small-conductance mechanosensitive channel
MAIPVSLCAVRRGLEEASASPDGFVDWAQSLTKTQCFNDGRHYLEEHAMISMIIFLLGLVLVGLIAGVFLMALIELRQIDDAAAAPDLATAGAAGLSVQENQP